MDQPPPPDPCQGPRPHLKRAGEAPDAPWPYPRRRCLPAHEALRLLAAPWKINLKIVKPFLSPLRLCRCWTLCNAQGETR